MSIQIHKEKQQMSKLIDDFEKSQVGQQHEYESKRLKDRESHKAAIDKMNTENKLLLEKINSSSFNEIKEMNESLEKTIDSLRAELKTTKDEMNFFRRELINREENYNSKFAGNSTHNNSTVGVMNVIKEKINSETSDNQVRRRSSMKNNISSKTSYRKKSILPRI